MEKAYVIGAGFSRAVTEDMQASRVMPLLDDLVEALKASDINVPDLLPYDNNLETWLSYLASEQPWLSDVENLENRILFLRVSQYIGSYVADIERSLVWPGGYPPDWLKELGSYWAQHPHHAVVTFNYDTLAERVVQSAVQGVDPPVSWEEFYSAPVVLNTGATRANSVSPLRRRVPRFFKMHGSINWRYSGLSSPGSDPIYLARPSTAWTYSKYDDEILESSFPHKEMLIVPPTGVKVGYYVNAALRYQWRMAPDELRAADELVVMGYSMPATDSLVRIMLRTSARPHKVTLVDLRPDLGPVLESLFPQAHVDATTYVGPAAMARYVASLGESET